MTVASWHTDLASDTLAYRSDTPTRGNQTWPRGVRVPNRHGHAGYVCRTDTATRGTCAEQTRPRGVRVPNQKLRRCMADRTSG
jgi:hypothetical protein